VSARAAGAVPQLAAREELLREHFDTLAALFDPATFYRIGQLGIGRGAASGWLAGRKRRRAAAAAGLSR
jgi:hypothetical protein